MAKKPKFEPKPWESGGPYHHLFEAFVTQLMSMDEDSQDKALSLFKDNVIDPNLKGTKTQKALAMELLEDIRSDIMIKDELVWQYKLSAMELFVSQMTGLKVKIP